MAHVKATANVKKWAMVAKGHLDNGRRDLAAKALKRAEVWEKKLKKLEGK
jgi:phage shock protein A